MDVAPPTAFRKPVPAGTNTNASNSTVLVSAGTISGDVSAPPKSAVSACSSSVRVPSPNGGSAAAQPLVGASFFTNNPQPSDSGSPPMSMQLGPSNALGRPGVLSGAVVVDNLSRSNSEDSWERLGDESKIARERQVLLAHRLHNVFQHSALPTAVVIAVLLLGLFTKALMEAHIVGRILSTYCALMSIVMTSLLIYLHMSSYTDPEQQRRIIRILLMVPIYAIDSCFALWSYRLAPAVGLIRDCYESYVIYNFFHLLMGYLGGEEQALIMRAGTKISHFFPLCLFPPFQLSEKTFRVWKLLLLQYMILKPFTAVIAAFLVSFHAYDESSWSFTNPHIYFVIVLNISVTLAFTSLLYFFVEFKDLLGPQQILGKFAAVKAVVFLSFWQGVLMGILVQVGFIHGSKEGLWTSDEVSTGVQDFLICIEMLFMCYVHHKVFPEGPYVPETGYKPPDRWVWLHVFSVSDVVNETVSTVATVVKPNASAGLSNSTLQENAKRV